MPFKADEIVKIYANNGKEIFASQNCHIDRCATYYADNGKGKGVEPYLQRMLGASKKLSDGYNFIQGLPNARIQQMFTTTYIVNSKGGVVSQPIRKKDYGPYLFNWQTANNSPDEDYFVWEAARGTSAAPTYFPIANVGGGTGKRSNAAEKWVVDGGMMSNDPVIWGISEAFRTGMAKNLKDIVVISLGTGIYLGNAGIGIHNNDTPILVPKKGNWSTVPWMLEDMYDLEGRKNGRGTLVNVILDGVQMASDSQLRGLKASGLKYYRLEPTLTKEQSTMDNIKPSNIESLIKTAETYLEREGASILEEIVDILEE